jgi:uncharacterized membrane protein
VSAGGNAKAGRGPRELGHRLEPGEAALPVLSVAARPTRFLPEIERYGGHVLQTSLSDEAEARLRNALGDRSGAGQTS